MSTLNVAQFTRSEVDGAGRRMVVYLQGCPIHCPGCQSKHLWGSGGQEWRVDRVAAILLDSGLPVTISGGEPFAQADAVADLLTGLRARKPDLHIIVYSGFCVEDLLDMALAIPSILDILNTADVLVDGPFIKGFDHDKVQWRGSANQRPINLRDTIWHGADIVYLALEDWDTSQTLAIDLDGDVIGTAGMMRELFDDTQPARMCGQVTKTERHKAWMRGVCDSILDRQTNPYATESERSAWEQGWKIEALCF